MSGADPSCVAVTGELRLVYHVLRLCRAGYRVYTPAERRSVVPEWMSPWSSGHLHAVRVKTEEGVGPTQEYREHEPSAPKHVVP